MIQQWLSFINQIEVNTSGFFAVLNLIIIIATLRRWLNQLTSLITKKRKRGSAHE